MPKVKKSTLDDTKVLRMNGLMESFAISLVILGGINIYREIFMISRGIDLIPCVVFLAIGVSAYLKRRKIMLKHDLPVYFVYSSPVMWIVAAIAQWFVPIPVCVLILGAFFLIMDSQIKKRI